MNQMKGCFGIKRSGSVSAEYSEEEEEEEETAGGTRNTVVSNASGQLRAGRVSMILGPSGSGKSVLLRALAGRSERGIVLKDGDVMVNGMAVGAEELRALSAYVSEEDVLNPHLTPRETLAFLALTSLGGASRQEREDVVDELLSVLRIDHVADTRIGEAGATKARGLSGGERRRVAIATALVSQSPLLLVDGITLGLDSATAESMVSVLKDMAERRGITVATVISQPSADLVALFDDAICLDPSGRVAYAGPVSQLLPAFTQAGYPPAPGYNPAEHAIDLMTELSDLQLGEVTAEAEERTLRKLLPFHPSESGSDESKARALLMEKWGTEGAPWWVAMWALMALHIKLSLRNKEATWARAVQMVAFGLLNGGLFFSLSLDQNGARDRLGLIFLTTVILPFGGMQSTITLIISELGPLRRELKEHLYSPATYVAAKVVADLPMQVVFTLLHVVPVYLLSGLVLEGTNFVVFTLFSIGLTLVGTWIGLFLSAALGDADAANAAGPGPILSAMLFAGWVLRIDSIVPALRWLRHLSFLRHGYAGLTINELQDLAYYCTPEQRIGQGCPIVSGQQQLDTIDAERDGGIGYEGAMLVVTMTFYLFLSFFFVSLQRRR